MFLSSVPRTVRHFAAIAAISSIALNAPAQTINTWTPNNSGTWNDIANWDVLPNSASYETNILVFGGTTAFFATNDLVTGANPYFQLHQLRFTNGGLATISGNPLLLSGDGFGGLPQISVNNTGAVLILNNLIIDTNLIFGGNGTGLLTNSGTISETNGSFGLIKNGTSTVALNASNSYTGGTIINAGRLILLNTNAAGNGTSILLNGGELALRAQTNALFGATPYAVTVTNGAGLITVDRVSGTVTNYDLSIGSLTVGSSALTVSNANNIRLGVLNASTLNNATIRQSNTATINWNGLVTFNGTNTFTGSATATNNFNTASYAFNGLYLNATNTVLNFRSNVTLTGTNNFVGTSPINVFGNSVLSNTVVQSGLNFGITNLGQVSGGARLTFSGPSNDLIGNVIFAHASNTVTYSTQAKLAAGTTILLTNSGPVTFNGSVILGGTNTFDGVQTIFTNVVNPGTGNLSTNNPGTVTINGVISDAPEVAGQGRIVKTGIGTLVVTNQNTFGGGVVITNGAVTVQGGLAQNTGLGTNVNVTIGGGAGGTISTLNLRANTNMTFGPNAGYVLNVATTAVVSVDRIATFGTNLLAIGGITIASQTLTNNSANGDILVVNGPVTVNGNPTFSGTGTMMWNQPVVVGTNSRVITKATGGVLIYNQNTPTTNVSWNVTGGAVRWQYNIPDANPVVANFATNNITNVLTLNGGAFQWAPTNAQVNGQVATLNGQFMAQNASQLTGSQVPTGGNTPRVQFTGILTNQGTLTIGSFDTTITNNPGNLLYNMTMVVDQTGVGTPAIGGALAQGTARGFTVTKSINSTNYYDTDLGGVIVDGGNPLTAVFRNPVVLNGGAQSTALLNLTGTNNWKWGTVINGSAGGGFVNVPAAKVLGSGNVYVNPQGRLRLASLGNVAAGKKVIVYGGGILSLGVDSDLTSLIDSSSSGVLSIDSTNFTGSLNMSAVGNGRMFLGASSQFITNTTYSGATLGAGLDNLYRLGAAGGTLIFTNNANILSGANGVQIGSINQLGQIANGNKTLDANANSRLFDISNSTNTQGIIILAAANNYSGETVINSGAVFANATGSLGTNFIRMNGGTLVLNAPDAYSSTAAGIPVIPTGALVLNNVDGATSPFGDPGTAMHVYGTLAIAGANGTLPSVNNIVYHPGSSLVLSNNNALSAANADRIADTDTVSLNGSTLRLAQTVAVGAANVTNKETIGTLIFNGGSTVFLNTGATPTNSIEELTFNNLSAGTLVNGSTVVPGTLVFQRDTGTGAGFLTTNAHRVFVGAGLATNNGMVSPNVILEDGVTSGFAAIVSATNNILVPVTYSNYAGSLTNSGALQGGLSNGSLIVNFTGAVTNFTTNTAVYALKVNGNVTGLGTNISIISGGLVVNSNATMNNNFTFGTNGALTTAYIHTIPGVSGTFSGALAASNIVKFGTGSMILTGTSNQNYAGGWNINQGTVQVNSNGGLGQFTAGNYVNLNGGATLFLNVPSVSNGVTTITSGPISLLDFGNTIRSATAVTDATNVINNVTLNSMTPGQGSTATIQIDNSRNKLVTTNLFVADNATLVVSNGQAASGGIGGFQVNVLNAAAGVTLTKVGGAPLYLAGNNSATFNGTLNVNRGALVPLNVNAFGSASSVVNIGSNAVLVIPTGLTGFVNPSQLTQQAGSAERWEHALARFSNTSSAETVTLGSGIGLQLNTDLSALTNKTIGLNGGTLEAFLNNDSVVTAITNSTGPGVAINVAANSSIGHGTADQGRAAAILAIDGLLSGAGSLTKIGADRVFIRGSNVANTISGGFDLRGGQLQVQVSTNGAGVLVNSTPLGTGTIVFGGGTLEMRSDISYNAGNNLLVTNSSTLDLDRLTTNSLIGVTTTFGGLTNLGNPNYQTVFTVNGNLNTQQLVFAGSSLLSNSITTLNGSGTNLFTGPISFLGSNIITGNRTNVRFTATATFGPNAALVTTIGNPVSFTNISLNGANYLRNSGTVDLNGLISESAASSLVKDQTGTLNITNFINNTWSGGFTMRTGTVTAAGGTNPFNGNVITTPLGTGSAVQLLGGTLNIRGNTNLNYGPGNGYDISVGAPGVILSVDRLAASNTAQTITINSLTIGSNLLQFNSGNSYILAVNTNSMLPSIIDNYNSTTNFTGSGILQINNTGFHFTNVNTFGNSNSFRFVSTNSFAPDTTLIISNGNLMFGATGTTNYLNGNLNIVASNAGSVSLNGQVVDGPAPNFFGPGPGTLIKTGAGTLAITNLLNNTYSGGTILNQGTLNVWGGSNFAAGGFATTPLGTGPVTLNGGTLNLRADSAMQFGAGSGYTITANSNATINVDRFTAPATNNDLFIYDLITASNAIATVSAGNGYRLGLNNNIRSNATVVAAGTLVYTNVVQFWGTNIVGGTWVSTNANPGAGFIMNGPVTFITPTNAAFAPNHVMGENGVAQLTKDGAGSFTFNSNNTYTGGTLVVGGSLTVGVNDLATPYGTSTNITLIGTLGVLGQGGQPSIGFRNTNVGTINGPGAGYDIRLLGGNGSIDVNRVGGTNVQTLLHNVLVSNAVLSFTGANNVPVVGGQLTLDGLAVIRAANGTTTILSNINEGSAFSRLVKQGPDALLYSNTVAPAFSGGTIVEQGSLLWRATNLPAGAYGFGSGSIYVDGGATFGFQNNTTNVTYSLTNDIFIGSRNLTGGGARSNDLAVLDFTSQNSNATVVTTGTIHLQGTALLVAGGGAYNGLTSAPVILNGLRLEGGDRALWINNSPAGTGGPRQVIGALSSDGVARNLEVRALAGSTVEFTGNNSGFAGDMFIRQSWRDASGVVRLTNTSAYLGGTIHVDPGTMLDLNGVARLSNFVSSSLSELNTKLDFRAGSLLGIGVGVTNGVALDFSATGMNRDVRLGAPVNFTTIIGNTTNGMITPFGTDYKLGGGGGTLQITGTNMLRGATRLLAGPNPFSDSTEYVTITPISAGALRLDRSNSFTGGTVIQSGTLQVGNSNALGTGAVEVYGTLSYLNVAGMSNGLTDGAGLNNLNPLILHPGSTLQIDKRVGNLNHFGDNETLSINGALVNYLGTTNFTAGTVPSAEFITNIAYSGAARVSLQSQSATNPLSLTASNLIRQGSGTLEIQASTVQTVGGRNQFFVGNTNGAFGFANGMVSPYLINGTERSFLTYNPAYGFSNVVYTTADLNTAVATSIVDVPGLATNLSNGVSLYALRIQANTGGVITNFTATVTNLSGGVIISNANVAVTNQPRWDMNNQEALIYVAQNTLVMANTNAITNALGITKFGGGTIQFNNTNTYAAGWNINQGGLNVSAPGALGITSASNVVNLNGNASVLRFNNNAAGVSYSSGPIVSLDNNIIALDHGANDRTMTIAPLGITLNSVSNGLLGSKLQFVFENRDRVVANIQGNMTLNANSTLELRQASGTANVTTVGTGGTNRVVLLGNLIATNRIVNKIGNATFVLNADNSLTASNVTINVNAGALGVGNSGALGGVGSILNVRPGAVFELVSTLTNFSPLGAINLAAGSAERWQNEFNRFAADGSAQTYVVPTGVNLQVATDMLTASNKTIQLNGGSIEGYQYIDDLRTNRGTFINPNVNIVLNTDSEIGASGVDAGRANAVPGTNFLINSYAFSNYAAISGAGSLTKIGADIVELGSTNNTYGGGTVIQDGILRNGANNALPVAGTLQVEISGNYELNGFGQTVGGLKGKGNVGNTGTTPSTLAINTSASNSFGGLISGNMGVAVSGTGVQELTTANTYTGPTVVSGSATLTVNNTTGSATGTNMVTLFGGILKGAGTIAGVVSNVGGTVAPGNSPGVLTVGSYVGSALATMSFELGTNGVQPGIDNDLLKSLNGVALNGDILSLTILPNFDYTSNNIYMIITNVNPLATMTGNFVNAYDSQVLTNGAVFTPDNNVFFAINYGAGDGNDVTLTIVGVVPEPGTVGLIAIGGALCAWRVMRRRRK